MTGNDTRLSQAARAAVARFRRRPMGFYFIVTLSAISLFVMAAQPPKAQAFSSYLDAFRLQYPASAGTRLDTCILCHTTTSGGPLNAYGTAYGANGHSFTAIAAMDSDGDGFTNSAEITALTFPGNAADHPAQATATTPPPTATSPAPTATSPAPTATSPNPTATAPGPTPTATATTPPSGSADLDIRAFAVAQRVTLGRGETQSVWIWLVVKNHGGTGGHGTATVVGVQNGVQVYQETLAVSAAGRRRGGYFFPHYAPKVAGKIMWTASLDDGNPDMDTATAVTLVTAGRSGDGDRAPDRSTTQADASQGTTTAHQPAAQPVVAQDTTTTDQSAAQPVVAQDTTTTDQSVVTQDSTAADPFTPQPVVANSSQCTGTHTVAAGENLFRIGFNCGFSLAEMATANGIGYPYTIYPGQILSFP
jgi:LysM repeat protein